MKKIGLYHLVIMLLGSSLTSYCFSKDDAMSYFLGSLIILFSFGCWAVGLTLIFQKKFIALAIGIIVFKYAILGFIIYWLVRQNWLQSIPFTLGVGSFALSALVYATKEAFKEGKSNVI